MRIPTLPLLWTATVLLVACQSGPSSGGITVIGKVITYSNEAGSFLPVMVNGQKTSTDASGNFTVQGVSTPYSLVVLQASKSQVYVYQGLTRPDPIVLVGGSSNAARKATINYSFSNFTNAAPPAGEGAEGQLGCVSVEVSINCGVSGSVGNAPYSNEVQWNGATNIRLYFHALQTFKNNKNVVTLFNRFARVENSQIVAGQPNSVGFSFQSVSNKTLGGSVAAPAGFTLTARALGFLALGRTTYPFSYELNQSGIAPNFTWASPDIAGMSLYFSATATKGGATIHANLNNVAPDNTSINLSLPAPAEHNQPANNALGITQQTAFSWTPMSAAAYSVSIYPTSSGPLNYTIYTRNTELTLPDLSSFGYPLPKGVSYRWTISSYGPVDSVNDLAAGVPNPQYAQSGYSGERNFTTAP
jgi:hypothetical protein